MATMASTVPAQKSFEDPLAYLPCSTIASFRKGTIIYTQDEPADKFCLVISGKVKILRVSDEGKPTLVDITGPTNFRGERLSEPATPRRTGRGDRGNADHDVGFRAD